MLFFTIFPKLLGGRSAIILQLLCDIGVIQKDKFFLSNFVIFVRRAWIVSVEVARTLTWPTVRRS